jgi:hypothetical protein
MTAKRSEGWDIFSNGRTPRVLSADGIVSRSAEDERRLNALFDRLSHNADFKEAVAYLRSITVDFVHGDAVQPNALVHLEGQRWIVKLIERRAANGRRERNQPQPESKSKSRRPAGPA